MNPVDIITWPIVTAVVGILGSAFVVYRWVTDSIAQVRRETELSVAAIEKRLATTELDLARNYITSTRLAATEDKLAASVDKLINRFDGFAVEFNRSLLKLAEGHSKFTP